MSDLKLNMNFCVYNKSNLYYFGVEIVWITFIMFGRYFVKFDLDIIRSFTSFYYNCEGDFLPTIAQVANELDCTMGKARYLIKLFKSYNFVYTYKRHYVIFNTTRNLSSFKCYCNNNEIVFFDDCFVLAFDKFILEQFVENFDCNNNYTIVDIISWMFCILDNRWLFCKKNYLFEDGKVWYQFSCFNKNRSHWLFQFKINQNARYIKLYNDCEWFENSLNLFEK